MAPVILLMGPTAAGKTDLALELLDEFPVEIVSVDSAMIYRGLDIGTGKPTPEVLLRAPHHLVDILDPSETYSAGQFARDARKLITEIRGRGKTPLFVGGTMLYFKALTEGIAELPAADSDVRADLEQRANSEGWPVLHEELSRIDPNAARKILPNDGQRIQRALEVFRLTGRRLSELQSESVGQTPTENFIRIIWSPADRAVLYERIAARFSSMMERGLLEEVRRLFERKDLSHDLPALRAVGYRQLLEHFSGAISLDEAVRRGIVATRHLARRQLVWLRAGRSFEWFDSLELSARDRIKSRIVSDLRA